MYVPKDFEVLDLQMLHEFMRRYSFATLVSNGESGPFASHIPLLFDSIGKKGRLRGHVSKANPHWHLFGKSSDTLAIFHGPHAYVSPTFYKDDLNVPTWNYASVHVYGKLRVVTQKEELMVLLKELVTFYEKEREEPWKFELPDSFIAPLVEAIVGFEMDIERIEGKFKLNQNRSQQDFTSVVEKFRVSTDPEELEVARLMQTLGYKR